MTFKSLLISLGMLALAASVGTAAAQDGKAGARKRAPLQVDIYAPRRRIGGYSYSVPDITNTYNARNPPPYADVRQTPSGPFDSGFFFDSGFGRNAGNAPYPN
jgi:hypothetical protein